MKEIENEKIFDLLGEKSFDLLNKDEKELVLKEMSKSEYEMYQSAVLDFKEIDDSIDLMPVRNIPQKDNLKINWWQGAIPIYQVAACLLLAISLTFVFTKKSLTKTEFKMITADTIVQQEQSLTLEKEAYPKSLVITW